MTIKAWHKKVAWLQIRRDKEKKLNLGKVGHFPLLLNYGGIIASYNANFVPDQSGDSHDPYVFRFIVILTSTTIYITTWPGKYNISIPLFVRQCFVIVRLKKMQTLKIIIKCLQIDYFSEHAKKILI